MARSRPRATPATEVEPHHAAPRDTVRRVPIAGDIIALVGFDANAKARVTLLVSADDITPELGKTVLKIVRKMYPREALHMDRTED